MRADADGDAAAGFPAAFCAFEEAAAPFVVDSALAAGFRVVLFAAVLALGAAAAALLAGVDFAVAGLAAARLAGADFAAVVALLAVVLAVAVLLAAVLVVEALPVVVLLEVLLPVVLLVVVLLVVALLAVPDPPAVRPRPAVPAAFLAALVTAERAAEATRCATPRAERPPVCWADPA